MTEWLNTVGLAWVQHIAQLTIQDSLFIVLVLAILFLLRRRDVRLRRAVAILGMAKIVMPTFLPEVVAERSLVRPVEHILISVSGASHASANDTLGWQGILMLAWMGVASIIAGIVILRTVILMRRVRAYPLLEPDWLPPSDRAPKARFVLSDRPESPFTVGILRPRIVLPRDWSRWAGEKQRAIIAHELSHISQWDPWVRILQLAAEVLYFFNPMVWLLSRRLTSLSEMACDEVAIRSVPCSSISYSRMLIDVVSSAAGRRSAATVALGGSSYRLIKERITHLMDNLEQARPVAGSRARALLVLLLFMSIALSMDYARAKSQILASMGLYVPAVTENLGYRAPLPADGLQSIRDRLTTGKQRIFVGDRRAEGTLVIKLLLDEEGHVTESSWLQKGCDASTRAVNEALDGLAWEPAQFNGKATASEVILSFFP